MAKVSHPTTKDTGVPKPPSLQNAQNTASTQASSGMFWSILHEMVANDVSLARPSCLCTMAPFTKMERASNMEGLEWASETSATAPANEVVHARSRIITRLSAPGTVPGARGAPCSAACSSWRRWAG